MGSGGTWLNAALDKGAGTPETWTLQPSVAGQDYGTVGPNVAALQNLVTRKKRN